MTQKTVAEVFVETMIAAGVTRIYGVVGDSLNGILEEIRRSKQIDWIGVRHEETAAFAAGAPAYFTGGLAGCGRGCCSGHMYMINWLYYFSLSPVALLGLLGHMSRPGNVRHQF